ncbi:hypothetical protein C8Q76DRAFT_734101 [Earliella scabrosa]|nr:hypothetical protein C8Q76DRAFT_734101 [Earliella scabrosa]
MRHAPLHANPLAPMISLSSTTMPTFDEPPIPRLALAILCLSPPPPSVISGTYCTPSFCYTYRRTPTSRCTFVIAPCLAYIRYSRRMLIFPSFPALSTCSRPEICSDTYVVAST